MNKILIVFQEGARPHDYFNTCVNSEWLNEVALTVEGQINETEFKMFFRTPDLIKGQSVVVHIPFDSVAYWIYPIEMKTRVLAVKEGIDIVDKNKTFLAENLDKTAIFDTARRLFTGNDELQVIALLKSDDKSFLYKMTRSDAGL